MTAWMQGRRAVPKAAPDGLTIVGSSIAGNNSETHAFRWTQPGGMADIGFACRKWPMPVKRNTHAIPIRPRNDSGTSNMAKPKYGVINSARIRTRFRTAAI